MLEDLHIQTQKHWNHGYRKHQSHYYYYYLYREDYLDYVSQLVEIANIDGIPTVFQKIAKDSKKTLKNDPFEFWKYKYNIIDDNTFQKEKYLE